MVNGLECFVFDSIQVESQTESPVGFRHATSVSKSASKEFKNIRDPQTRGRFQFMDDRTVSL